MRHLTLSFAVLACALGANAAAAESTDTWASYLDYAYVYSSASPAELRARLDRYAREGGITLEDYVAERLDRRRARLGETEQRRRAVGHLLAYIAAGDPTRLQAAVSAVNKLEARLERHENRYWYHYIHAHRALEEGDSLAFVSRVLRLWREVVVELEAPYDTYQTLSLNDARGSGFVSALPYVYENVARMVLIRSQRMGVDRGLDPLAAVVRFLDDGRVGAYPDVVPTEASSREYLDAIISRLDGAESDGGSLTFTLALFEAGRYHDQARARLADEGFSKQTLEAVRVAIGSYERALARATTLQGQAAVYTRVLRQVGELHAAKQRLGEDPQVDVPFSIERAIKIYTALHADRNEGWENHGYRDAGREAYVAALHGLWQEIQEASFNVASYYLQRGVSKGRAGNEDLSDAVRTYSLYLKFFERFSEPDSAEGVPDAAYFAAHEAARGIGDAILNYAGGNPSSKQLDAATRQYLGALERFPFEPGLWASAAVALERQGREAEYLDLTARLAGAVTESRAVDTWINAGKEEAARVDAMRRALADDLAIMYLGFTEASEVAELEAGLDDLRGRRAGLERNLAELRQRLEGLDREREDRLAEDISTLR